MKGLVVKNTGSWYVVRTDDGQLHDCKVKGNFRLKGIRTTNPVAIGDRVTVNDEKTFAQSNTGYCVLLINFRNQIVTGRQYTLEQEDEASAMFTQTEQSLSGDEAVILVSIEKMQELREAYPSYFLDTKEFLLALDAFNASCAVYK